MGKLSRDKGARWERQLVNLCKEMGWPAARVPLSGAAGGQFSGDIKVTFSVSEFTMEAKCRARGFMQIYDWLEDNDGLFVKQDRCEPLVIFTLSKFKELMDEAEGIA